MHALSRFHLFSKVKYNFIKGLQYLIPEAFIWKPNHKIRLSHITHTTLYLGVDINVHNLLLLLFFFIIYSCGRDDFEP